MSFPDAAITAAFLARVWDWLRGRGRPTYPGLAGGSACASVHCSASPTLSTKAYAPIIGMGALGGIVIGFLVHRFGH
jgi:hypothetical protein